MSDTTSIKGAAVDYERFTVVREMIAIKYGKLQPVTTELLVEVCGIRRINVVEFSPSSCVANACVCHKAEMSLSGWMAKQKRQAQTSGKKMDLGDLTLSYLHGGGESTATS